MMQGTHLCVPKNPLNTSLGRVFQATERINPFPAYDVDLLYVRCSVNLLTLRIKPGL